MYYSSQISQNRRLVTHWVFRIAVAIFLALIVIMGMAGTGYMPVRKSAAAPIPISEFEALCPQSHRLKDDPIVLYGLPGASHDHTFLGNDSTNAFSTVDTLAASTTTCSPSVDKSSYWVPTVLENGVPVNIGLRDVIYYLADTITDKTSVRPFPYGYMMLAGNAKSTGVPTPRHYDWTCLGVSMPVSGLIPTCPSGTELELHLFFPECWDGLHVDSPNHRDHTAYASGGVCPADHPVVVPRLSVIFTYQTLGGPNVTLSSGPSWTAHGDFFNAWVPSELQRRVVNCLDASVKCGTDGNVIGVDTPTPGGPTVTPLPMSPVPTRVPATPTNTPAPGPTNTPGPATPTSTPLVATPTPLPTGSCGSGTNLIANPGFESGTLSPWILATGNGGPTHARVHSGSWSGYVGTGQGRIEQTVSGLTPNTTYTLCGSFTLESTASTVQFGAKNFGGTTVVKTVTTSASFVWVPLSLSFTTGPTSTSATIFFEQPTVGGNYGYSDDWSLKAGGTTGVTPSPTSTPTVPAPAPTATSVTGGAKTALLITGVTPISGIDSAILNRLQMLGYTVTVRDAAASVTADATGKTVVFISSTVESGNVGNKFTNINVPIVTNEVAMYPLLGMVGSNFGVDSGNSPNQTQVVIVNPSHPLAGGQSGTVTVVTSPSTFRWGVPAANALKIATITGNPSWCVIFGYDTGVPMVTMNAPARRVAWITDGMTVLTGSGWKLFDTAINWAAGF